ncbi:hypothetical protein PZL18_06910 [Staphylococcus epidermidis]|nr:hypothetical protein [Staphylococcus epidermidis]MDH9712613.1 hypothetical protein [Staphylococcus epidermidis]MDH9919468.1 hypothetical protein [Staphylococcus epidermidis]MDH9933150.1 hypothetical protein [Staphylococcus epidermidis]MDH9937750.1 hypothetical protein [Staphylococcus epidermidis]
MKQKNKKQTDILEKVKEILDKKKKKQNRLVRSCIEFFSRNRCGLE